MENPLANNPEEEKKTSEKQQNSKQNKEEKPKKNPEKDEGKKKKGLTVGRIIAIFAGLLIIGTVVGAVIYSQTAERFRGATGLEVSQQIQPADLEVAPQCPNGQKFQEFSFTVTQPTTDNINKLTTSGEEINISLCVCNDVDTSGNDQLEYYDGSTCVPVECNTDATKAATSYTTYLESQLSDYSDPIKSQMQNQLDVFETKLENAINQYQKKDPECQPVKPCDDYKYAQNDNCVDITCSLVAGKTEEMTGLKLNIINSWKSGENEYRINDTTYETLDDGVSSQWYNDPANGCVEEKLKCPDGSMEIYESADESGNMIEKCYCPIGEYYDSDLQTCTPIDCDITYKTIQSIVDNPDDYYVSEETIQNNRLDELTSEDDYRALFDKQCACSDNYYDDPANDEGCVQIDCNLTDDERKEMVANWSDYRLTQDTMDTLANWENTEWYQSKCVPDTTVTREPELCGDNYFDDPVTEEFSCIYLCESTAEQRSKMFRDPAAYSITDTTHTNVQNWDNWSVRNCPPSETGEPDDCPDGTFYQLRLQECIKPCDERFETYFTAESIQRSIDSPRTSDAMKAELRDILEQIEQGVAYDEWYADTCITITQEPECTEINILEPAPGPSMTISEDFSEEPLEIEVIDMEAVDVIRYSTSEVGGITFGDANEDEFTSNSTSVLLNGGPADGETEVIKIQGMRALDDKSLEPLDDRCYAYLEVTKEVPEEGECTIEIDEPTSSNSYEIDSPFSNEELAFNVTGGEEIDEYTVSSSEGTIDFIDADGNEGTNIDTTHTSDISMNGGPSEGNSDTITVIGEIVSVTGAVTATCEDTLRITRPSPPPEREPVRECRSLRVVAPPEAVNGVPTVTIDEDGYVNEELRIEIDADAGAVEQLKYASDNDTITFDGQNPYWVGPNVLSVDMNGGPDPGGSDVVSVWAVDPAGSGIQECNDGFVVQVERPPECPECPECPEPEPCPESPECPEPEPCPPCPEDGVCPPCPEPEPCPPCPEPGEPEPTEPRPAAPEETEPAPAPEEPEQPLRPGAPEQPKTGPGVLLYVIGAGVGGAILRRRKNRQ